MESTELWEPGDRIEWDGLLKPQFAIVLRYAPKGTMKRMTRSELVAFASAGLIPKDGVNARRDLIEERAGNDRYIVLRFSLASGHKVGISVGDIPVAGVQYRPSRYLLNSQWLIYQRRKRKELLAKQRAKRGEA